MQSPLDDVPKPLDALVERDALRMLGVFVLLVLVFALGYLAVLPNHEAPGFSDVQWVERPVLKGPSGSSSIVFSILLRSFEKEDTSYYVRVQVEESTRATKSLSMAPQTTQQVDFSIPVKGEWGPSTQVKILITRPGSDVNAAPREVLELVDYLP